MENTPKNATSDSGCFNMSNSMFQSTPTYPETHSTPVSSVPSRKRKFSALEDGSSVRKLADVSCQSPPQCSSTYNESFMENLEKFHIRSAQKKGGRDLQSALRKFQSVPSTPEKQIKYLLKKETSSSFVKNFSQINVHSQSPLNKESYNILYPELPPLEPQKKPLTPQKFKETVVCKISISATKSLSQRELLKKVFTNHVIMNRILKELSNGDLFRLCHVSRSMKDAVLIDKDASPRYFEYARNYRNLKENYKITPPSSPEKEAQEDRSGASPRSQHYYSFFDLAKELNKNQSLTKCPSCNKPAIVENNIAFCQSVNSCGYIYCQKCNSFAHNPSDFKDMCNNVQMRSLLGDLSNSNTSDYFSGGNSTFFNSYSLNLTTSNQYLSEIDAATPPLQKVKRNLTTTFNSHAEPKVKILSSNNTHSHMSSSTKHSRRRSTFVLAGMDTPKKSVEPLESSSPPRVKQYSACSKQSRRNLKRLTR